MPSRPTSAPWSTTTSAICEDCATVLDQWRLVIAVTGELRHDEVEAIDPGSPVRSVADDRLPPGRGPS